MNENLYAMILDFCSRAESRHTPEHVIEAMKRCPVLVTDEGFFVYQIWMDEIQILFAYVKPGVDGRQYAKIIEDIGRINHCKVIKFCTNREKGFARLYSDYTPSARLFEKELT